MSDVVEREWLSETTTPDGIQVRYGVKPKRRYEVRNLWETYVRDGIREAIEGRWEEVPSVTTVLDILNKPLAWWGQGIGVQGVLELVRQSEIKFTITDDLKYEITTSAEEIVGMLTEHKLTVNHQRDKAGDRGTAVHDAFEFWALEGVVPKPDMFPPEERGYVVGLCEFLRDVSPEPVGAEVMVGSVEHGFAGRYDIRFETTKEVQVVHHRTPKRGPQYATLKPGLFLGDLKTSKSSYVSHHLQLAAYELASIECGYGASDAQGIVHVGSDGTYELIRSHGQGEDFLAILDAYRALERVESRRKQK